MNSTPYHLQFKKLSFETASEAGTTRFQKTLTENILSSSLLKKVIKYFEGYKWIEWYKSDTVRIRLEIVGFMLTLHSRV